MLTVKHIEDLVSLMSNKPNYPELSFVDEIKQYRLLALNLPRKTGKSTAIRQFARGKSALFLDGTASRNLINFRGHRGLGLRYQYIIADEQQNFDHHSFFEMLIDLKYADMLTDDFKVILIGTTV